MSSPELSALRTILRARPAAQRFQDPRAARTEFEEFVASLPDLTPCEAAPATAGGVPGEWVTAPGVAPERTLVLLHGGGYVSGSPRSHRDLAARLAGAARARVFVVDYRRAPEDPFPAAYEDCLAAVGAILDGAEVSAGTGPAVPPGAGPNPAGTGLVGDSAGGGLALAVCAALRDAGRALPAALVCLSPWADLAGTGDTLTTRAAADPLFDADTLAEMAGLYAEGHALTDPRISPLYAELGGLPPTLIQVGDHEVMLADSTRLAERLEAAGVDADLEVWPEMIHGWQVLAALLPEGREAVDRVGAFLRRTVTP